MLVTISLHLFNTIPDSCTSTYEYLSNTANIETPLEISFKDGSLLLQGVRMLSEANPELKISTPEDASIINSRLTDFDISLIPLLERIPISFSPNIDIGIHSLSENGIKYSSEEFISFTKEGKTMFKEIFDKYDADYLSAQDPSLTKESFILSLDYRNNTKVIASLLERGRKSFRRYFKCGYNFQAKLPDNSANIGTLYLLVSTLEKMPSILKQNITRSSWYWLYRDNGIEFINKSNLKREFVKFSKDPKIAGLEEIRLIKDMLRHHKTILRGNMILNQLDNICIHNETKLLTRYDILRADIEKGTNASCPLSINNYNLFKDISTREKIPIEQVSSFRFSIKEMTLIYKVRLLIPKPLVEKSQDLYFSYRPKYSMFFTGTYSETNTTYALSPFSLIDITRSKKLILNNNLKQELNALSNNEFLELAFARVVLHEKAHSIYIGLSEDIKKKYSNISWDTSSWKYDRSSQKSKEAESPAKNHFLIKYPDWPPFYGHDSSEEDFSDHFAAYIVFGPAFRNETKNSKPLSAKYDLLKSTLFEGIEFENNLQIQ